MEAISRNIISLNWITFVCLFAIGLLIFAKTLSNYKFFHFLSLIATDKYVKLYKEDSSRWTFHYILTSFQVVVLPLAIHISLFNLNKVPSLDFLTYIKIVSIFVGFYAGKFIVEKLFALLFKIDNYTNSYLFEKQTYQNYLAIICFPILLFLVYSFNVTETFSYILIGIFLFFALLSIIFVLTHYRTLFYSAPLYFILYLCAFEIAPYLITYKVIVDNY